MSTSRFPSVSGSQHESPSPRDHLEPPSSQIASSRRGSQSPRLPITSSNSPTPYVSPYSPIPQGTSHPAPTSTPRYQYSPSPAPSISGPPSSSQSSTAVCFPCPNSELQCSFPYAREVSSSILLRLDRLPLTTYPI